MSLKILFLSHQFYPDIGGIEINSEILADSFVRAGHAVLMLTWSIDPSQKKFPFPVIRKPSISQLLKGHFWADVVLENNPCLRLSWPRWFIRRPAVIAVNTWIARVNGARGFQDKVKLRWLASASRVIAVSEAIQKHISTSSVVIGNPYKANEFKRLPGVSRNKDFVFLGRLVSDKGASHAIHALQRLSKHLIQKNVTPAKPTLTIIGEGPERKNLELLVEKFNLQDQVVFTGSVIGKELTILLNQHKFILIPSIWDEPFGNVALEGMACGCLPIASDGGGLPSAVGKAGLTYRKGNIDSLVECIVHIWNNPHKENLMAQEIPNHLRIHQPEEVARQYLKVIETAVAS